MKKIKNKGRHPNSLLDLMINLLHEIFCLYPRLPDVRYKKKTTSKVIEIIILHDKRKIDKRSEYKRDSYNKTTPSLDDWSVIAVNDENGTVNTLPALVLSEEESKNLQQILAKYDL